jgi:4-carboxymuconolactone decarboxylase
MAKAPPSAKRDRIQPFVPALVQYTHDVVYGDLWERPGLSKRDRSLITLAAIIATYRPEQLTSHLGRAINNGVTKAEISEVITHLAFYAGWPAAMSAAQLAYAGRQALSDFTAGGGLAVTIARARRARRSRRPPPLSLWE